MKYDAEARLLSSDDGTWSKRLDCPLNKKWNDLQRIGPAGPKSDLFGAPVSRHPDLKRHCPSCTKDVIDISTFDDRQVGVLVAVDPVVCVHASSENPHIKFEGISAEPPDRRASHYSCSDNTLGVPVVHTGRTIWAINAGAKDGYWPLLRPVKPSARIRQKFLVSQSSDGTIDVSSDYRDAFGDEYWFNPYHSPLPFAAYLIPPNLPIGARVYLSDLIEDIEAGRWNQGDSYRAQSGYAIWNGDSLELEQLSSVSFVG